MMLKKYIEKKYKLHEIFLLFGNLVFAMIFALWFMKNIEVSNQHLKPFFILKGKFICVEIVPEV